MFLSNIKDCLLQMAQQIKNINIALRESEGAFFSILNKIKGGKKNSGIANLRQVLTNEKARLLYVCKTKKPDSIYKLSKLLGRDFKAVRHDVKLLESFGFIELISSHKEGRERLMPLVDLDRLIITIDI
jgi:hypothetical protein